MRSQERDRGGTVALTIGPTSSATSGVFKGTSIPYTVIRAAVGQYEVRFDSRLLPFAAVASAGWNSATAVVYSVGSGGVVLLRTLSSAGAATDTEFDATIYCLDKRT